MSEKDPKESLNFIEQMIENDLKSGKNSFVQTRFPPEPNGYLHIGHAKSIVLNFGLAEKYNGSCNLRFDDTNPEKESEEYVNSIKEDIKWLGYTWSDEARYTSNYFDTLYEYAVKLIKKGKAYIDDQSAEEISAGKTNPTIPGIKSPFRDRSVEENLDLFERMKNGEFDAGSHVLRAKIDMDSPNMHMRDPIIYRIKKVTHHNTGDTWCIYPNYDFAHGQSDSIEHVTYSLCTLEFRDHKALYDWFINELEIFPSNQTEFARLNLSYTIVSKRKLLQLVEEGHVTSWDDPRMPTISGFRRRGYTPDSIKNFVKKVGVARRDGITDVALLEHSIREDLNKKANRVFGIQKPLKMVITNWPADKTEMMQAINNPEDETAGTREMPFTREVYIESKDFMEEPPSPKKFFGLGPDREVRLKYGYIVKCTGFEKDADGNITEIHCTYDPETRSGNDTSGKKVKGTLGWVSIAHAVPATLRLYDRLFSTENLNSIDDDFLNHINPDSLTVVENAMLEPSIKEAQAGDIFQFERQGYFVVDRDSTPEKKVFNRTITLRDNWAK
ncbi:glutamine--tRNA ligase/YqeY domain fusion protein [Roseivirga echinicomitans]|uniref:Glutamine--tRNA ligase n=1 Tax=Roseivirga echinicomitans TaxID=296218 RepID=A0A150X398_9BACT|nr:glutamine--tRNA ligase/YqeY domain fusion protein [Roseivirga echinicomitans]KYG73201.1 glutamine--tRNA ligase [Roseivirga echinicomitans]